MTPTHRYRFDHVWQVPLPLGEAYDVLQDIDSYALWWPQIRRCERVDDRRRRCAIRSFLPVTLTVLLTDEARDREQGLLRVGMEEDLVGYAQWQLTWAGGTTTAATWTQEVLLAKEHLDRLPGPARRALALNHTHMMRSGEAGLRRWLRARPA